MVQFVFSIDFWLLGFRIMSTRLPSKSWSCSELVRGAAQVVDDMAAPSLDAMVVDERLKLLGETSDLDIAAIEKLLQDHGQLY